MIEIIIENWEVIGILLFAIIGIILPVVKDKISQAKFLVLWNAILSIIESLEKKGEAVTPEKVKEKLNEESVKDTNIKRVVAKLTSGSVEAIIDVVKAPHLPFIAKEAFKLFKGFKKLF